MKKIIVTGIAASIAATIILSSIVLWEDKESETFEEENQFSQVKLASPKSPEAERVLSESNVAEVVITDLPLEPEEDHPITEKEYLLALLDLYYGTDRVEQGRLLKKLGLGLSVDEYLEVRSKGTRLEEIINGMFHYWVERRPEEAMKRFYSDNLMKKMILSKISEQTLLNQVYQLWKKSDPQQALDFARKTLSEDDSHHQWILFELETAIDPIGKGFAILAGGDARKRKKDLRVLGMGWPLDRLEEAVQWGESHLSTDAEKKAFNENLLIAAFEKKPQFAMELSRKMVESGSSEQLSVFAMPGLALEDMSEAKELIGSLADPKIKSYALLNVAHVLAERDIDLAIEWVNQLEDSSDFDRSLEAIYKHSSPEEVEQMTANFLASELDSSLASTLLNAIWGSSSNYEIKSKLIAETLESHNQSNPDKAVLLEKSESNEISNNGEYTLWPRVSDTFMALGETRSPEVAYDWIKTLPFKEESDYHQLAKHGIEFWALRDSVEAKEWVDSNISDEQVKKEMFDDIERVEGFLNEAN